MGDSVLEVCVDSLESALAAHRGGADRLELCANLVIGGTTPSIPLFRAVQERVGAKIHVLLRPRFGDFLYSQEEYELLREEAVEFLKEGADGIVCGFLREDGSLWPERMEEFVSLAHSFGKSFTLHRAFDVCENPFGAMELSRQVGVDRILTSGQAASCLSGISLLKELEKVRGKVILLYGAGIDDAAIWKIRREIPESREFHMSGKRVEESAMKYRKPGVSMGLPSLSEFELWRCDEEKIKAAKRMLKES